MQKVTIKRAENGYVVRHFDGEKVTFYALEARDDEEDSQVEAMSEAFRLINDLIGPMTSRYSSKRIYITTGAGDKHGDAGE